jgi:hypothetical protein
MADAARRQTQAVLAVFAVFALLAVAQFAHFEARPLEDFYQPSGYIAKVNKLIAGGKLFYARERTRDGYRGAVRTANLAPEEQLFLRQSWLEDDIRAFNDGDQEVFLIDKGKLQGINIYRHRIESPLATDWTWWGRIYSQSAEGYAYLWNSRRTLKLYRPPPEERTSAKVGQAGFREVVYGKGHFFQTGLGITIKGRRNNRIADLYSLGENIVLKSYAGDSCFVNGHPLARGEEERLDEGDLVQINFEPGEREQYLFHDFSRKPLSFVNVLNGRLNRTNLDSSFHMIDALAAAIESAVKKNRSEKRADFDVHLALDEDLSGVAQNALESYVRGLPDRGTRASCTIMNGLNGQVLALASISKGASETNENLKLHPVGSATKIFLAAAAAQSYPDLLSLSIDPHSGGDEKDLLGYQLNEGYKLRAHGTGDSGRTDFPTYIAKSCNRYHAILMALALAKESAANSGRLSEAVNGLLLTGDPIDTSNGTAYLDGEPLTNRPDLSYFVTAGRGGTLECNDLDQSELALNLEKLFDVRRKYVEGSRDSFTGEPWNLLFARLGMEQMPDIYPAFYSVMPQTVNLGLNLNIDFRLDFISIIFGGATNRWNNVKLAEAISRLVADRRVQAHFVDRIQEEDREWREKTGQEEPLGLNPDVREQLLGGMEGVCLPGGTAGDLQPLLGVLQDRALGSNDLEFYAKTGTPFRREIRKGQKELYSSVLLLTAVQRDRQSHQVKDVLSFSVYIEDQGEHRAVDFMKQLLPRVLQARRWIL